MGIVSAIIALLGVELVGFSVGDYVISKSVDIGTGLLWGEINRRLPKNKESLEGQLYDAIEASVKRYSALYNQDQIASACEILYGSWIKNGHLSEINVKSALMQLNTSFLADRNIGVWYRQFYEEIIKRELLYRWYMLHTTENLYDQIAAREEIIAGRITQCIERQQMQVNEEWETEKQKSQSRISNQIFQQILKEDIYLKQIYVSLHGKLKECNIMNGWLNDRTIIVDTTNYIWEWYEREHVPLLFLHGEPGIGKSSLVKMIAATMVSPEKTNGLVAFIELHRLAFSDKESALSVVEKYIEKQYPWFFNKKFEGKRLLIIDGLDEIRYKVYDNSVELAKALEVCNWTIPWAGIISGRSQVVKKALEDVRCEELEIMPLFLDEYELAKRAAEADDPENMLKEDLREIYWNKLTGALGIKQQMPLTNERFDELSKSPLLLFLVIWTIKHADSKFQDFKNTAELYDTIFRHIYTREYNRPSEKELYFKSREYREYQQMLHYLGGCAYRDNSRAVAIGSVYEYCKSMGQTELCENWIQLHKNDNPSKLVLLFFLREEHNEMDWQQSEIEFIHKTFYEYLAAIAVIEFLYRITKDSFTEKQMKMMFYLFSNNILDDKILNFIEEIIQNENLIIDNAKITRQCFATMLTHVFTWGVNVNYPFFISDADQQNERIEVNSYQECMEKIRTYETNMKKLLEMFVKSVGNEADEYRMELSCVEFSKANMMWWVFDNAQMNASHFEESIISGTSFRNCIMQGALFLSAVGDRTEFMNADLSNADFSGAHLAAANFTDAILEKTIFELSDLEGAYFCNTVLNETKFAAANLTAANFDETVIINVDFHDADLSRADFSDAKIESANWDNCIMEGAKLNGVKLMQFDLQNPNIIEMLAEADLEYADWIGVSDEIREMLKGMEKTK